MCRYKGFPSNLNTNKLGKTDYNGRLAHNVFIDTYYTIYFGYINIYGCIRLFV